MQAAERDVVRVGNKPVQQKPKVFVSSRIVYTLIKGIEKHLIAKREELIAKVVVTMPPDEPQNYQQKRPRDGDRQRCDELCIRHSSILSSGFSFRGQPA